MSLKDDGCFVEVPVAFDFADVIGAGEEPFLAQIWVYIPRKGHDPLFDVCDIDRATWDTHKRAIAESLAAMATGVTVTSDFEGGSMEAEGLVWEPTVLAYVYVQEKLFTLERVQRLRDALYRFGRETRQTRIGVELIDPERSLFLIIEKDKYGWA